jgi:hypothetical protein
MSVASWFAERQLAADNRNATGRIVCRLPSSVHQTFIARQQHQGNVR